MAKSKERITLVGAGNVSRALATLLPRAGYSLDEIILRSGSRKKSLAIDAATRAHARPTTLSNASLEAEVIWLVVGDAAIRSCAEDLSRRGDWKGKIALHSSGALTSDELNALRRRGASVASVHPMMSFVSGVVPDLRGVAWAVEGDPRAVRVATAVVRSMGGTAHRIKKSSKPLYHAFGAFLSPLLVVQLATAAQLARRAGIPPRDIATFMAPIVTRTLENLFSHIGEKNGSGKAFSGPLVRGDIETIRKHLKTLRPDPSALNLYRALLQAALASDLPVKKRDAVRSLLRRA